MTSPNGNHLPRCWPFVCGIHWSPVNSPHKAQWHRALTFALICTSTNICENHRDAGDLRRHYAHYEVTVMFPGLPYGHQSNSKIPPMVRHIYIYIYMLEMYNIIKIYKISLEFVIQLTSKQRWLLTLGKRITYRCYNQYKTTPQWQTKHIFSAMCQANWWVNAAKGLVLGSPRHYHVNPHVAGVSGKKIDSILPNHSDMPLCPKEPSLINTYSIAWLYNYLHMKICNSSLAFLHRCFA